MCAQLLKAAPRDNWYETAIQLWADSAGVPCRAFLRDMTLGAATTKLGKTVELFNMRAPTAPELALPAGCAGSTPQCRLPVDLVVIIDTVMDAASFEAAKETAALVVESFEFDQFTGANVGVYLMADAARSSLYLDLNSDKRSVVNAIRGLDSSSIAKPNSLRCYACAMEAARTILLNSDNNHPRARTDVLQAVIWLASGPPTERYGQEPTLVQDICDIKGIRMLGLGKTVPSGTGIPVPDLKMISCEDKHGSGIQVNDWTHAQSKTKEIAKAMCMLAGKTGAGRCGAGCNGVCGSSRQCECPSLCECAGGRCDPALGGSGCLCTAPSCTSTGSACFLGVGTYPNCNYSPTCSSGTSDPCASIGNNCSSAKGCYEIWPECGALLPSGESCKYTRCKTNVGCELIDVAQCGPPASTPANSTSAVSRLSASLWTMTVFAVTLLGIFA
jgi:von Willebrand factor type A domain